MTVRYIVRIVLAFVVAGVFAAWVVSLKAQDAARAPLLMDGARISIAGTTNVHDYTVSTTTVRLAQIQVPTSPSGPNAWDALMAPGGIQTFEISIPAASLKSPKGDLDKNMHKALKVEQYKDITFKLRRLEPGAPGTLSAIGTMKIAGIEREVTLPLKTKRTDSTLTVSGTLPLVMTDYGITPPKAMLGMLKTDPKVTITFEAVLTIPLL